MLKQAESPLGKIPSLKSLLTIGGVRQASLCEWLTRTRLVLGRPLDHRSAFKELVPSLVRDRITVSIAGIGAESIMARGASGAEQLTVCCFTSEIAPELHIPKERFTQRDGFVDIGYKFG